MTAADASSESTMLGVADAGSTSMFDLERRPQSAEDLPLPVSEGDLRDTFDLPLISARDADELAQRLAETEKRHDL